jgi:plastocyanin
MKKLVSSLAIAGLAAGLTAPAVGSGPTVKVSDYKFRAKTLHVSKGATVTWKFVGSDAHNVTGSGFKSGDRKTGTFKHKFSKAGTFKYRCTIHNASFGMHGTVVVG